MFYMYGLNLCSRNYKIEGEVQLPFISAGDQGQFSVPPRSAMTASIIVLVAVWLASAKKLKKVKMGFIYLYIYIIFTSY